MKSIEVVAAIIRDDFGCIFATQRNKYIFVGII